MTTADRVSQELRLRPRVALLSAAAGVLLFANIVLQSIGPRPTVSELTIELLVISKRAGLEILGAVVSGLGLLALIGTLIFLFSASRARRPQMSQATLVAAIVGGLLAAVAGVASAVAFSIKAHEFATHGAQTYEQANALISSTAFTLPQYAGLLGALLVAVVFVLVSLNAMRVGLLTRFLGFLGIAAAAASVVLAAAGPLGTIIEVAWLLALAYLLSGRWPNGDPPAWRTGQAVPWPSSAELREQRQRGSAARGKPAGKPSRREPAAEPVGAASSSTRATTPKRKRKRRK